MRCVMAAIVLALTATSGALADIRDPVLDMLRIQAEIERRLLVTDFSNLERIVEQLQAASDRLVRLSADLLRAHRDGEEVGSFNARNADLRRAEAEVMELITGAQQLRATIAARRGYLEQVQGEVRALEEAGAGFRDELSGRWNVAFEPGALRGDFDLRLDGTLLSGVYQLSGGWRGSLRGTFIGGNVRLERIDSQLGFVAVYIGRLVMRGDEVRVEGTWEATNLAAGTPTAGSWVAIRERRGP